MSQPDERLRESLFTTLVFIRAHLRSGVRRLNRDALPMADWMFEKVQQAHDYGLTRIRETVRDPKGRILEIVFEQALTPVGEALLNGPVPRFRLPDDVRQSLRQRLRRQLETGESGGSPMINGLGEPAGDLSDFLSPEQIRENARRQLEIMDEQDREDATGRPVSL